MYAQVQLPSNDQNNLLALLRPYAGDSFDGKLRLVFPPPNPLFLKSPLRLIERHWLALFLGLLYSLSTLFSSLSFISLHWIHMINDKTNPRRKRGESEDGWRERVKGRRWGRGDGWVREGRRRREEREQGKNRTRKRKRKYYARLFISSSALFSKTYLIISSKYDVESLVDLESKRDIKQAGLKEAGKNVKKKNKASILSKLSFVCFGLPFCLVVWFPSAI